MVPHNKIVTTFCEIPFKTNNSSENWTSKQDWTGGLKNVPTRLVGAKGLGLSNDFVATFFRLSMLAGKNWSEFLLSMKL